MRVRTDVAALVTAAVLSAVLSIIAVGNGQPSPNSGKPLVSATAVEPQPTMPKFQGVGPVQPDTVAPPAAEPSSTPQPKRPAATLDSFVLQGLLGGLIFIGSFLLCHLGLRRLRHAARWSYAGIGAVSALASIALQTPGWGWRLMLDQGLLTVYLAIVMAFGAAIGFIYRWRAGLEAEADDPARLAQRLAQACASSEPAASADAASEDDALVSTGDDEYFSGPLQVRTTVPVMFVASLVSAGAFGLAQVLFGAAGSMANRMNVPEHPGLYLALGLSLQAQLDKVLIMGLIAPLPFTILILLGHTILKAMGRTSYPPYIAMGACAPLLVSLIMGPMGLIVGLQAAVPMIIAMCVYRSMAGLEPVPVKEDILVKDRRDLVGADHVRRQYGRVVKG